MQDGTWRMLFNVDYTFTSTTGHSFTVNGVTSKTGVTQAGGVSEQNNGVIVMRLNIGSATNVFSIGLSGPTANINCYGDIELNAKPTWAY